jgi:hypothetical protein
MKYNFRMTMFLMQKHLHKELVLKVMHLLISVHHGVHIVKNLHHFGINLLKDFLNMMKYGFLVLIVQQVNHYVEIME